MMDAENNTLMLDGQRAVRARDLEPKFGNKGECLRQRTDCTSDALGFTKAKLPEFQEHLKQTGCKGIEFRDDPDVPGFVQVQCDSQKAKLDYAKTRGLYDRNSKKQLLKSRIGYGQSWQLDERETSVFEGAGRFLCYPPKGILMKLFDTKKEGKQLVEKPCSWQLQPDAQGSRRGQNNQDPWSERIP